MTFDEYASHDDDVKTCEPLMKPSLKLSLVNMMMAVQIQMTPMRLMGMIQIQIQTSADNCKKMKSSGHQCNFLDLLLKLKLVLRNKLPQKATQALNVVENAVIESTCQAQTKQSNIMAFFKQ